jgi:hypothetical protein
VAGVREARAWDSIQRHEGARGCGEVLTVSGSLATYMHPITGAIVVEFVGEIFMRPRVINSLSQEERRACSDAWIAHEREKERHGNKKR